MLHYPGILREAFTFQREGPVGRILLRNAQIFTRDGFRQRDLMILEGRILLNFSEKEREAAADLNMD